jgi:hypothetical protein
MVGLHWGIVKLVSGVIYIFMLVTLPFSITASTVFLFTLITFWSRLPGVSIITPLWILYMIDLVDLMGMIVAINVGGIYGAILTAFCNFVPRIAGITPAWSDVVKDTIIQPIICLIIPFIYHFTNNIDICMIIYTLLRQFGFFIANFIYPEYGSFPRYLILFTAYTITQTFINYLLSRYFGNFFNSIIVAGVNFNLSLFMISTVIILFVFLFKSKDKFGLIKTIKILKRILVRESIMNENIIIKSYISDEDLIKQAKKLI